MPCINVVIFFVLSHVHMTISFAYFWCNAGLWNLRWRHSGTMKSLARKNNITGDRRVNYIRLTTIIKTSVSNYRCWNENQLLMQPLAVLIHCIAYRDLFECSEKCIILVQNILIDWITNEREINFAARQCSRYTNIYYYLYIMLINCKWYQFD